MPLSNSQLAALLGLANPPIKNMRYETEEGAAGALDEMITRTSCTTVHILPRTIRSRNKSQDSSDSSKETVMYYGQNPAGRRYPGSTFRESLVTFREDRKRPRSHAEGACKGAI